MSNKKVLIACVYCDSEFKLEYSEELVSQKDSLVCPFCGEPVEDMDESEKQEFEDLDYSWDDDE